MNFFKRFFGKQELESGSKKSEGSIQLSLEAVEDHLNEFLRKEENLVLEKSLPSVKEILRQKGDTRKIVQEIGELEFDEDIKDRTYKPIITSKPVYVRSMLEGLKGIKEKIPESFEELEIFYSGLTRSLKSIQSVQQKKGRYMSFAFRTEMLKLGTGLNKIIDLSTLLGENISQVSTQVKEAENAMKTVDILKENLYEIKTREERSKKLAGRLKELDVNIDSIQREITKLEKSKEHKDYLELVSELEAAVSSKKNLETAIFSLISPLRRPLRKLEKYLERKGSNIDKGLMKKLAEYQATPTQAFSSEDSSNLILEKILREMRGVISKEELKLDKKEKDKTLSRVKEIENRGLKSLLLELIDLTSNEEIIHKKLSESIIPQRRDQMIKKQQRYTIEREDARNKTSEKTPLKEEQLNRYKVEVEKGLSKLENTQVLIRISELDITQENRENI
jgi:hypothetical protein